MSSSSSPQTKRPFANLRAATIDGRLANPIYRQEQLQKLLKALTENAERIRDAIVQDYGHNSAEAAIEYFLTLKSIKNNYACIDPVKELEEEYAVTKGKDCQTRKAYGIVYIVPTSHTLFYSAVTPLSAAITAGNCVILQVENTLRTLPALLTKIVRSALDHDIFDTTSSRPDDSFMTENCLEVIQEGAILSLADVKFTEIISPSSERVVAVVDRTADIDAAAQALATARSSFGATSPYAPDVVLVNEFVKKEFLEAVVRCSIPFLTGNGGVNGVSTNGSVKKMKKEVGVRFGDGDRVVTSGSNGSVVVAEKRDSSLLTQKIDSSCIVVHAVSSLDDAIDLANSNGALLANYTFANPSSAKYLTQFINARTSYVNHVPVEILVGPATPLKPMATYTDRYPVRMFTSLTPVYSTPTALSQSVSKLLGKTVSKKDILALNERAAALPAAKKRPEKAGIGFFEQGVMLGASIYGVPLLTGLGWASWKAASWGISKYRS